MQIQNTTNGDTEMCETPLDEYLRFCAVDPTERLPARDSRRRLGPGEWLRWRQATDSDDFAPLPPLGEHQFPVVDQLAGEEWEYGFLDVPALRAAIPLGKHPQQVSQSSDNARVL